MTRVKTLGKGISLALKIRVNYFIQSWKIKQTVVLCIDWTKMINKYLAKPKNSFITKEQFLWFWFDLEEIYCLTYWCLSISKERTVHNKITKLKQVTFSSLFVHGNIIHFILDVSQIKIPVSFLGVIDIS